LKPSSARQPGIEAWFARTFPAAKRRPVRITTPIPDPSMGLWLLNHPDVQRNATVTTLVT
jgi:hypothetical protein